MVELCKVTRTVTIPKDDYDLYLSLLENGERLDEYAYNEVIEKYFAHFPNGIEAIVEFINSDSPYMKISLKKDRSILQKRNESDRINDRYEFIIGQECLVLHIVRY